MLPIIKITSMRSKRKAITTESTAIERALRKYYKQISPNKFNKLRWDSNNFKNHKLLKLTNDKTKNLNSHIFAKIIKFKNKKKMFTKKILPLIVSLVDTII